MSDTAIILIGVLGFLLVFLFDVLMLKKIPHIKFVLWLLGTALIITAITLACLSPVKLPLPGWTVIPGWFLFGIGALLVLYSLFINIPFRKTYVASDSKHALVRTGLYALCRHPGTYWVNLFLVSLILVSQSLLQLIAALIFITLNTLLVIIEDKFIFPGIFADYPDYQRKTPMLFPNTRSISDFTRSLPQIKTPEKEGK